VLDEGHHAACVDAWLERSAKDLPPERLLILFEAAVRALWGCTSTTLGEVTLTAIADRVLYNAGERFPSFSLLKLEPSGELQGGELRERVGAMSDSELVGGIRYVLVEFLTVLGNLTAEILTPELQAELSAVALPEAGRVEKGMQSSAANREQIEREGKKS
jgi:hypothetical protein